MNEFFSITLGQDISDFQDIAAMEESSHKYLLNISIKGEILVKMTLRFHIVLLEAKVLHPEKDKIRSC